MAKKSMKKQHSPPRSRVDGRNKCTSADSFLLLTSEFVIAHRSKRGEKLPGDVLDHAVFAMR